MSTKDKLVWESERYVPVIQELALLIGDRHALAFQQLHYWLKKAQKNPKPTLGRYTDGKWWIYNTWDDWRSQNFPYWSDRTIRRIFKELEESGLIISTPHENDKRGKWYTIDYYRLESMKNEGVSRKATPSGTRKTRRTKQNDQGKTAQHGQNDQSTGNTESTSTENKNPRPPSSKVSGSGYASRGKQPPTGGTRKASEIAEEEEARTVDPRRTYTPLASAIMEYTRRLSIPIALCNLLDHSVPNWLDLKGSSLPSPNELWEENELFRQYVKERIIRLLERSGGMVGIDKIIAAVYDYNRPHVGWIAYQKKHDSEPKGNAYEHVDYDEDDDAREDVDYVRRQSARRTTWYNDDEDDDDDDD